MAHISYSELKEWVHCPLAHKLAYVDGLREFKGNEYTAFGSAVHSTCEKLLVEKKINKNFNVNEESLFKSYFKEELDSLDTKRFNKSLVENMEDRGSKLATEAIRFLFKKFGEYELISVEEKLEVPINEYLTKKYNFKGFIDLVIKTKNGRYHIIDWKTCSWGWNARRKNDKMTTYQLTLYKHYFSAKYGIDPKKIETHFILLKRTAKKDLVELVTVQNKKRKIDNAVNLLTKALYNIDKQNFIMNKTSCFRCEYLNTKYCSRRG